MGVLPVCMRVYHVCVPDALKSYKKVLHPLEMELQTIVSSEILTQVLGLNC